MQRLGGRAGPQPQTGLNTTKRLQPVPSARTSLAQQCSAIADINSNRRRLCLTSILLPVSLLVQAPVPPVAIAESIEQLEVVEHWQLCLPAALQP